jgi:ABC-type Mn2+/Zn2+ transport system permease subunit
VLFAHASPVGDMYVHELLRGEILAIGLHELDTLAVVLGLVALSVIVLHRDLALVSYDRDQARVLGLPVRRHELLLQFLTGATVATGVMTVGPVVLFGFLVIPPLAARALARSMVGYLCWSATLGLASGVLGLVISKELDWPLGPAVVVSSTLIWIASRVVGVLRRRWSISNFGASES